MTRSRRLRRTRPPAARPRSRCCGPTPRSARRIRSLPTGSEASFERIERAFARARRLIYVEDQYMWSREIAALFASALRREPDLRVIVVVPRFPDRNGIVSGPPHRLAQLELIERLRAEADGRFAIYDLENDVGTPIYVHAKTVVIDDVWAAVGSDNLNRRSWTHDSELSIGVLDSQPDLREPTDPAGLGDGARVFARDLRLQLMREHTGVGSDDGLLDPVRRLRGVPQRGGCARCLASRGEAWTAASRAVAAPPSLRRAVVGVVVGDARSIGCSSTPTAGPGGETASRLLKRLVRRVSVPTSRLTERPHDQALASSRTRSASSG